MLLLEGEHIRLRALEPSDVDILYRWENDPQNWFISNTLTPFSKHALARFIENSQLDIYQTRQLRLMIIRRDNDQSIGAVDLFDIDPFHRRAGLGILIQDKQNRNKGYASDTLDVIIHYAFHHLKFHQLYCNIAADNDISIKLFKKKGFRLVGEKKDWLRKNEGFIGELMFQLLQPDSIRS